MEISIDEINIEKLRNDLIDYFGSAMYSGFPVAMMDVIEVENASDIELINIAIKNKIDLSNYINGYSYKKSK